MEYKMGLQSKYFNLIKKSEKTVEVRLNDAKRQKLKVGDIIEFCEEPDRDNKIDTIVVELDKYNSFSDAIDDKGIKCFTNEDESSYLNDLEEYYPKDKQEENGVLAITVSKVEKHEKSCGAVVFKNINDKLHVLLIHHNLGHWGIPKGHVEGAEVEVETAKREVLEETGIEIEVIPGFRESITYSPKKNVLKDVIFFIGKSLSDNLTPQLEEVQEVGFIPADRALEIITYAEEKDILEKAIGYIEKNNLKY